MRCLKPRTVGFKADGKTIAWSQKYFSKEFATFQLPCTKCIACRLEYSRQWAIRCVHEARMYEKNSFITLTYSDEKLLSPKLQYSDFQSFVGKLRDKIFRDQLSQMYPHDPQVTQREKFKLLSKETRKAIHEQIRIGYFVTGEYGDKFKRPHWHALVFNYRPEDILYKYSNDRGDRVYSSTSLDTLWSNGITEVGSVTFHSAGYVARYAAKKLVHGHDGHEFEPISKKSSHQAIGKKYLEKYWPDVFNQGHVIVQTDDGPISTPIPRYYEKWFAKNHPALYEHYVTSIKQSKMEKGEAAALDEKNRYWETMDKRSFYKAPLITKAERQETILTQKFNQLQTHLKGDI